MTKIVIMGSRGRMGQMLLACAAKNPELQVTGQVDLGDPIEPLLGGCDVVVDFSFHDATPALAVLCAQHKKALVIGTTGFNEVEQQTIRAQQSVIPMVWTSNYSTGVNTLFWLTRQAAEILGPGFDLEIVEMHHRFKKDAPSGTATTLANILATVRHQQLQDVIRHGRHGITGERTPTEIGMHSLRGGDVVGDHTVVFAALGERLELTHKAASRETLASGALHAAQWVGQQKPGIYDMQDVLGLRTR
jgi:4-hydroxy-tetrahydrodipicolinate reductase